MIDEEIKKLEEKSKEKENEMEQKGKEIQEKYPFDWSHSIGSILSIV